MPQNVLDSGGGKILSRMKLAVCLVMVGRDVDSILCINPRISTSRT